MLTKTAFGMALVIATVSGSLAATRHRHIPVAPATVHNVYNPSAPYVGTDPDPAIRFELNRDWARGR